MTTSKTKRAKRVYREADMRRKVSWVVVSVALVVLLVQGWNLNQEQEESALLAAERDEAYLRAELIVTSAPVAIVMCGETGHIALCNPMAEKLFGWEHDDLMGKHISSLIPKGFHKEHDVLFNKAIEGLRDKPENWLRMVKAVKTTAKNKAGESFPILLSIRMIKYNGKIEFISSVRIPDEVSKTVSIPLPPLPQEFQQQQQQKRFRR